MVPGNEVAKLSTDLDLSQAMLFNLIGDPVRKKDYDFFTSIFNYDDIQIDQSSELLFELSDRKVFNEKQQQPFRPEPNRYHFLN
jgi:hypothetical protein